MSRQVCQGTNQKGQVKAGGVKTHKVGTEVAGGSRVMRSQLGGLQEATGNEEGA